MPPIYAYAICQVVRLVKKFDNMESQLTNIVRSPMQKRKRTSSYSWLFTYHQWMNQIVGTPGVVDGVVDLDRRWYIDSIRVTSQAKWEESKGDSLVLRSARGEALVRPNNFKEWQHTQEKVLVIGMRFLTQAQTCCIALNPFRDGVPVLLFVFPLCQEPWDARDKDTQLAHYVFSCPILVINHMKFLTSILELPIMQSSTPTMQLRLLLGGQDPTRCILSSWIQPTKS